MREIIKDNIGHIKVGGTLLPGIFQSMEIEGELRIDEKDIPGSSAKAKQPMGFEDAKVKLIIRLLTDEKSTCYQKLKTITSLFHKVDKHAKPHVYKIVNHLTDIWKLKEVLFKTLRVTDTNQNDSLDVSIDFEEYHPVLVATEKKAKKNTKNSKTTTTDFSKDETTKKTTPKTTKTKTPANDDDKSAGQLLKEGFGGLWDWSKGAF